MQVKKKSLSLSLSLLYQQNMTRREVTGRRKEAVEATAALATRAGGEGPFWVSMRGALDLYGAVWWCVAVFWCSFLGPVHTDEASELRLVQGRNHAPLSTNNS